MFNAARIKLYRNLVLETFHRGRRGTLRLTMPGGACRLFGGLDKELHAEMTIKSDAFYRRWVLYGFIGLAESYLHEEWETPDLTHLIAWFFLNTNLLLGLQPEQQSINKYDLLGIANRFQHLFRSNSKKRSSKNSSDHYDLGNAFFQQWMDSSMTYSAAYYQHPNDSLEEAQKAKYDHLCKKLHLMPHEYILDIGCGWGGFAIHAARNYGCRVQAATISEEQFREAATRVEQAGVADLVEVIFCDYRNLNGRFDKIVVIEMLDAVGDNYIETFFAKVDSLLAPQGVLGLQMILCPDNHYPFLRDGVDFIQKHIFPGSLSMSLRRITEACDASSDLNLLDYEDLTPCYARTALAWREAFTAALPTLRAQKYTPLFLRKWFYYLCYYEAAFGTRSRSLVQALYTRPNNLELTSPIYSL